ncbi:MAG: hypothetical protein ABUL69_03220 [Peristeroidobacter soli]
MTELQKKDGQRKTLPVLFATLVGAGALVLVFTRYGEESVASASPVTILPASQTTQTAGDTAVRRESPTSNQQRLFDIERALVSDNPRQRELAFNMTLPELLDSDPRRVTELVARQEGETRDALRDEVVRHWIRKDRDAAKIWMGSLEGEERRASATTAMRALAAIEPAQAVAVANEFGVGYDDGSLEHIVQTWATENFAECARWLETQPNNPRTAQLRARIEQVHAQTAPDQRD